MLNILIAGYVFATTRVDTVLCQRCSLIYSKVKTTSKTALIKYVHSASAKLHIKLTVQDVTSMLKISFKESSFKTTTTNKRSSAYGLFGFLNRTWENTGIRKTSCPKCQTEAALIYIRNRYTAPSRAYRFHTRRGYY